MNLLMLQTKIFAKLLSGIALGFQLSINAGRKGALFLLSKIELAAC